VAEFERNRDPHQVVGRVIPALLVVFAVVLLGFGMPKLLRRRAAPTAPATGRPADRPPQSDPVDPTLARTTPRTGG